MQDDSETHFLVPKPEEIMASRIVSCTCLLAGALATDPRLANHFTHIFVDESAQALEPETLLPLSLAGPLTTVRSNPVNSASNIHEHAHRPELPG